MIDERLFPLTDRILKQKESMNNSIKFISILFFLSSLLLGGCNSPEVSEREAEAEEISLSLTLDVQVDNDTRPDARATTRADEEYEKEGTPDESAVHNLVLFIVPLAADFTEIRNSVDPDSRIITLVNPSPPAPSAAGVITATFQARIPSGMKHIYVGANLSAEMITRFTTADRFSNLADENKQVILPIADADNLGTQGIAMLGQLTVGGSAEIDLASGENDFTGRHIVLSRLVAKVLTLCKTELKEGEPSAIPSDDGWVDADDIYFSLVNTATEFKWASAPVPGASLGTVLRVAKPLMDEGTGTLNPGWMRVPRWDADKIGESVPPADHYSEGIFCLENAAGTAADPTATLVLVAARYLPKVIVDEEGGVEVTRTCATRAEALSYLTDGSHPAGTFWAKDNKYYTSAGRMLAGPDGFTEYTAGWGYYYTPVNGEVLPDGKLGWSETASCIHRNCYYLLTVTKLMVPGIDKIVPPTGNPNIEVNMELAGWTSQGGGEENIDLSEED